MILDAASRTYKNGMDWKENMLISLSNIYTCVWAIGRKSFYPKKAWTQIFVCFATFEYDMDASWTTTKDASGYQLVFFGLAN